MVESFFPRAMSGQGADVNAVGRGCETALHIVARNLPPRTVRDTLGRFTTFEVYMNESTSLALEQAYSQMSPIQPIHSFHSNTVLNEDEYCT